VRALRSGIGVGSAAIVSASRDGADARFGRNDENVARANVSATLDTKGAPIAAGS